MEMKEIWKVADNYPGYEVSNLGRVRSVDRTVEYQSPSGIGSIFSRDYASTVLKQQMIGKSRHAYVMMSIHSKMTFVPVGRLVATAFLDLHPGQYVHHIDGNNMNNRVDNLKIRNVRSTGKRCKAVKCVETGETWESIQQLVNYLGITMYRVQKCIKSGSECKGLHYQYV